MRTKALFVAVLAFAACGVAHASGNKPLNLNLPQEPLSDDWFAPRVTPTTDNAQRNITRRSAPQAQNNTTTNRTPRTGSAPGLRIDRNADRLDDLRSLERRLTTLHYGNWDVRLKPRSEDRGSLEVTRRGVRCLEGASCQVTLSAQRLNLYKYIRDSYEGREVGNFYVDKRYRRTYNPVFDGLYDQTNYNINMVSVTFRMTWR